MLSDVAILIVDDREEHLFVLEAILSSADYKLVRATSGMQALRCVLDRDFAVILIDVVMPGMDGFELARVIKQRERSRYTPIIFLTAGESDVSVIYRGYSVGAVDYLTKPLDADVLRAKVAIFVEMFRKDRRIHEQAEALRAVERRERDQRYRNLAEAIPHIVWTATPDGEMTYFNERWYDYTGQSHSDARGTGWTASVDDSVRCAQRWRDGLATRSVFELECRLRRHDGELAWHLGRAVPELDGAGLVGWVGTFTDIDALKRAYELAEQAIHARDDFLAIAAHELRTPLTTLRLRLAGLDADLAGADERIRRKLESSLRQGVRLHGLIESLFEGSRIIGGRLTLSRERFDLAEVARELVDQFGEAAAAAGVELSFRAAGAVVGLWDRLRIEQILQNLIANALKYAPNAPVSVSVVAADRRALVEVTDSGRGVSPEDIERIFGPFERAASTRNYGGLGLGLFIARENAAAHGGAIRVRPSPGGGATFVLELPVD
jgi:PAS domain S-box-containing protein